MLLEWQKNQSDSWCPAVHAASSPSKRGLKSREASRRFVSFSLAFFGFSVGFEGIIPQFYDPLERQIDPDDFKAVKGFLTAHFIREMYRAVKIPVLYPISPDKHW